MKKPNAQEFLQVTLGVVSLAEGEKSSVVEALRVGIIQDRGLEITDKMLADYVANHEKDVYGTPLQVNIGHFREGEAAGWIKRLFIEGESLMMEVEWTELGIDKISKKLYKFVSSELAFDYPDSKTGDYVKNVFIGAALTNVPAMKNQVPIKLSEEERQKRQDLIHHNAMFNKLITDLKARTKLSAADVSFARTMLSEVPEAEKQVATKEVDDLEAKQKEQAEADEKAAADAKKKEDEALAEKAKGQTVSLAEHMALKEKVEKAELKEAVSKTLVLSTSVKTGFKDAELDEVVSFMHSLTSDQRAKFNSLMGKVVSVDLNVIGETTTANVNLSGDESEAIVALAQKKFDEAKNAGKEISMSEAQKAATAEVKAARK